VAYNARSSSATTNNDSFLFGPNPDPRNKAVYDALADAGVRDQQQLGQSAAGCQLSHPGRSARRLRPALESRHWLDAAGDVSRRGVINVFSAGNSGCPNASVRSALPYFQPDLEGPLAGSLRLTRQSAEANQCGIAKYWCITTPGAKIDDSTIPVAVMRSSPAPRWRRRTPPAPWRW
jgi:subtilase-type serine protease